MIVRRLRSWRGVLSRAHASPFSPERSRPSTFVADYLGLAVLILLPVLGPGYLLIEDMIFVPFAPEAPITNPFYPLYAVFRLLAVVCPMWLIQKAVLLLIFSAAGCGAHLVVARFGVAGWPRSYAGLAYTVNPYVYDRLMYGQWGVLLAYALLPWTFLPLLQRRGALSPRRGALSGLGWALAASVDVHAIPIFGVVLLACAVCNLVARAWSRVAEIALCVATAAALSAYWIAPALGQRSEFARLAARFSTADLSVFTAVPDPHHGLVLNLLAGYGFWAENTGRYLLPKAQVAPWWLVGLVQLALALIGLATVREGRRGAAWAVAVAVAAVAGLFLAMGVSAPVGSAVTLWLSAHMPLYRAMRDSAKWLALLMFAYAVLGSLGLAALSVSMRAGTAIASRARRVLPLALFIPIIATPTLFLGGQGQLHLSQYPASWYAARQYLLHDAPRQRQALFLPWHEYLWFPFSRSVIANPGSTFFPSTIVGDNLEAGPLYSESPSPRSAAIVDAFVRRPSPRAAAQVLRHYGIATILLAKTLTWGDDELLLRHITGVSLVWQSADLQLYRYVSTAQPLPAR